MATGARITGLGYCGMDYLCRVPYIPMDDKVEIIEGLVQGGGPSVTAIAAAARLGAATAFIGSVGDDEAGREILRGLVEEGIDVRGVRVRSGAVSAKGFCWIEKSSGKRSIAWTRGTVPPLAADEIDPQMISGSRVLHLDGHQTVAAIAAARIARQQGVAVSIDAGTIVPGIETLLELSDILIASESFARRYTGESSPEAAVRKLFAADRRFAAVTLGGDGSIGFDGTRLIRQPSFKVDVVDTTGAGDVFHGAFVYAFAEGWPWSRCLRFASAVAALKCTRFGGRTGIPDRNAAEHFLEHHE